MSFKLKQPKNSKDFETIKENLLNYAETFSTDPITKVAACYYQAPCFVFAANLIDENLPAHEINDRTELFYNRIKHAEIALLEELGYPTDMPGPVFTTCYPCIECQKVLAERGVNTIYYIDDHLDKPWSLLAHYYAEKNPRLACIKI